MKAAGVAGAITFLTTFSAEKIILNKQNNLTMNQRYFLYCSVSILLGTACVTYAKKVIGLEKTFISQFAKNFFIDKKTFTYQLIATSFIENIVGFCCMLYLEE